MAGGITIVESPLPIHILHIGLAHRIPDGESGPVSAVRLCQHCSHRASAPGA